MSPTLGIVIVNYNTSELTLECLRSIERSDDAGPVRVAVVDNDSAGAQRDILRAGLADLTLSDLDLVELTNNTGFAVACNRAIAALLADPGIERILLLNNDAVLVRGGLAALLDFADANDSGMLAARMHPFNAPGSIDSLGIAMYASGLASNRMRLADTLLGPTGGLGLYSRQLLETVCERHGYVFDEHFFCYAEDTDLALRARLLGFDTVFFNRCIALHHGQASSGGGFSDFVLYHGIRNSIWALTKNFPLPWLILLSPLIVALHCGIVLRHSLGGRSRVVWRLYRDAFKGLPAMWRSRRLIQGSRVLSLRGFGGLLTRRFYDQQYLRKAWQELWSGRRREGDPKR